MFWICSERRKTNLRSTDIFCWWYELPY